MTEREAKLTQELGWIRIFTEGMNIDNWQDMRLRILRQLNQIKHGDPGQSSQEKENG